MKALEILAREQMLKEMAKHTIVPKGKTALSGLWREEVFELFKAFRVMREIAFQHVDYGDGLSDMDEAIEFIDSVFEKRMSK